MNQYTDDKVPFQLSSKCADSSFDRLITHTTLPKFRGTCVTCNQVTAGQEHDVIFIDLTFRAI